MNLEQLRLEIDAIDAQMMALFKERMKISKMIGSYKKAHQLPVLDSKREEVLLALRKEAFNDEVLYPYYETFLKTMLNLSKEYQK